MKKDKYVLPPIGLRIIKSAIAVFVCFLISFLRGESGIVFYSQLAALWCVQIYKSYTKKNAMQRTIGTCIGAVYGLVFLLGKRSLVMTGFTEQLVNALAISGLIVLVLYTTVVLQKKQASYFSCVVFLSIAVNHVGDANPYLFVWNRFLDTMIGIAVGIGVNQFSLPVDRRKDILFISGLDDTLLHHADNLSDYSKVELNRMLDDGVNFTLSTMLTPASLIEPMRDIRLKLPVIAMDGAVLYDINTYSYRKVYLISNESSHHVLQCIRQLGLTCFVNSVVEDTLFIYYEACIDGVQKEIMDSLRRSPYRNYVQSDLDKTTNIVYFMCIYPSPVIEELYELLEQNHLIGNLKVVKYDSQDHPGYSYIKIYNGNATRENMTHYLLHSLGITKTITFGSIPERCDVWIEPGNTDKVVHELKRRYEPYKWLPQKEKIGK